MQDLSPNKEVNIA